MVQWRRNANHKVGGDEGIAASYSGRDSGLARMKNGRG